MCDHDKDLRPVAHEVKLEMKLIVNSENAVRVTKCSEVDQEGTGFDKGGIVINKFLKLQVNTDDARVIPLQFVYRTLFSYRRRFCQCGFSKPIGGVFLHVSSRINLSAVYETIQSIRPLGMYSLLGQEAYILYRIIRMPHHTLGQLGQILLSLCGLN